MTTRGDAAMGSALAEALDVASSVEGSVDPSQGAPLGELEARAHVHGFHTYPARMHPLTARRLVLALSRRGEAVLDPFCGSGTVLVEARLEGRVALGSDVNPLAIALARRKVAPASPAHREALLAASERVAAVATERRKARSGASRRYPPPDVAAFDPHVLLELDGVRVGIEALPAGPVRDDLFLVLSSILVKLSRKPADTVDAPSVEPRIRARSDESGERPPAPARPPTRLAAGYPTRHFLARTREFVERLALVEPRLTAAPRARIELADARALGWLDSGSADAIVTSPPYAGVYDYVEHHRLRLRWLGLDATGFARSELGAKRQLAPIEPDAALAAFDEQMSDMLAAMGRVLRPGGLAALLVADSAFGATPVRIDDVLARLAPRFGLEPRAAASQARPHFHGPTARAFARVPRFEHVLLLERRATAPDAAGDRARSARRSRPR